MTDIVLVGTDNTLNRTIFEILQDRDTIQIQHWPVDSMEEKLKGQSDGAIDVLLADLRSFSKNNLRVVKTISEQKAVKAVLAIHIYTSPKLVKRLIDAGVTGYLTQNTNEQQLLNAIESILQGKTFIGIKQNKTIREIT